MSLSAEDVLHKTLTFENEYLNVEFTPFLIVTLTLKYILAAFLANLHDVVTRRTQYELRKAQEKAHVLEGLIIASQNIDELIQIIKAS